ncbi:isocitrate lyase/PEP mutase family protein [Pseudomonas fluorescens]|uniref:isocitrate lyase/PEP mutase family protein n=1 Tax=Pseudomonas fluorescens TaxID=294 RepID=UPI000CA0D17F|nr:isocitrate lyase/phosphoenolpyruvate mutase family protein [Pseudomonas fluorescens]AUM70564.1 isocitrate lyase/phosphoenolpyruvate mutase family protein [Pseudomonas fluorescens]
MNQSEKVARFTESHRKGNPLLLYNAWDAGSAKSIFDCGAKAVATSSWAMARAQGYRDGEMIPFSLVAQLTERIVRAVDAPVSLDFEGGYCGDDDSELVFNVLELLSLGITGLNFEDRIVKGQGLYGIDHQANRIAILREAANTRGASLFINARTDLFLKKDGKPEDYMDDAIKRAQAYAAAGASGFFIPGLVEDHLIREICDNTSLPVNVMLLSGMSSIRSLSKLGVARISFGPTPYVQTMSVLQSAARVLFSISGD